MKISTRSITGIIALFAFVTLSSSCKKKDDAAAAQYQVSFYFAHKVGSESLQFDTIRYINAFGNHYSIATLKYFISNITLHKSGGGTLIYDEEHYVDATDSSTFIFIPADKIPPGNYSGISFIYGLDTIKNVTGRFLNPPESEMEWPVPMGGGYHYMKLEGKHDSSGVIKNYQAHTGQLMGIPYFINVTLPASSFTITGQGAEVRIVMDINEWWMNPNILDLNDITGIMGNGFFQQQLKENGADVFSVGSIH
jgi:hypothetical protein